MQLEIKIIAWYINQQAVVKIFKLEKYVIVCILYIISKMLKDVNLQR